MSEPQLAKRALDQDSSTSEEAKRLKTSDDSANAPVQSERTAKDNTAVLTSNVSFHPSRTGLVPTPHDLPPSLELVTGIKSDIRSRKGFVSQEDVGIIGYAGKAGAQGIRGVIKQRYV
jgi:hypothetical protein